MDLVEKVGKSVLAAVTLVVVFSYIWPLLPKEGGLSGISLGLVAVVSVVAGWIVVGPPGIAMSLLEELGW